MGYCGENGHDIKNGICVNCKQVFKDQPYSISYWTTIKNESIEHIKESEAENE